MLHFLKIIISYEFPISTKDWESLHCVQGELQDLTYKIILRSYKRPSYFLLIIKDYIQTEPSDLHQKT